MDFQPRNLGSSYQLKLQHSLGLVRPCILSAALYVLPVVMRCPESIAASPSPIFGGISVEPC
jgi:hypothetical protein